MKRPRDLTGAELRELGYRFEPVGRLIRVRHAESAGISGSTTSGVYDVEIAGVFIPALLGPAWVMRSALRIANHDWQRRQQKQAAEDALREMLDRASFGVD